MATVKAPLFGLDASGALGGAIVFSKWKGRAYVRRLSIPSNPKSGLQVGVRSAMRWITTDWASLTAAQKTAWNTIAKVTNITDLNAMVAAGMGRNRRNLGIQRGPSESSGTTPDAPTIDSVTDQPKTLVVAWTVGAAAPEYSWIINMSKTTAFSADVSNQIYIVKANVFTLTIPSLTTGTEYFITITGTNFDGEKGTVSSEDSGTPT